MFNPPAFTRRGFFGLLCWLTLLLVGWQWQATAHAQEQPRRHIKSARLEPLNNDPTQGWGLNAELELNLGTKLKDALNRGLPLQFAWDVVVVRKRWYWSDQELAKTTLNTLLAYNALTRTYRVQTPMATYNTSNLEEALGYITKVKDWPVLRREQLPKNKTTNKPLLYPSQVRFRLVLTELPKPFQISALVNSDWDLYTDWQTLDWGNP